MTTPDFLRDSAARPLTMAFAGMTPISLYLGQGQLALEIVVLAATAVPNSGQMQAVWKQRRGGRAVPVLAVVLHGGNASLCGPTGDQPPVLLDADKGRIERLCRAALAQPDRNAAISFVSQALPSLETRVPGLRNEGLFALHELTSTVSRHANWAVHGRDAKLVAGVSGRDLLGRLGFQVERLDNLTMLLRGRDRRLALAVLLDRGEIPEAGLDRFNSLSPVSYALSKADQEGLDWVVMVQEDRLRLYPTKLGVGVGRRGRTETYVELQTSLLSDEHLAFLPMLFSAEALGPDGTVATLLDNSKRFAGDLAVRLRERIYVEVVPRLAEGIATARRLKAPTAAELDLTYRMALTALFRLLFVAYAEDRDLLPYRLNEAYRRRSLKQKAQELAEHALALRPVAPGTTHWDEVVQIWTAIESSNTEWSVPAYDGGLFTADKAVSPAGAALASIRLPNTVFEPALKGLLLIETDEAALAPVDFRSLGVREFGTIYEGLLESELSVADQDLALDAKGSYVPVKGRAQPVVTKGQIYLHNKSGARKSSGSYFTKSFAVEHLLDRALEPALIDHCARLDGLDETDAAESFFDFRVADIAMGSGHFLVAAVDRIERALTDYIARRPLPGVRNELLALKQAAKIQLGDIADQVSFEDGQLLRRLIARRCIYGVDLNALSVELSRLSIWIHTFVPGLPLTVLDRNLVQGNALVGVGTIAEIRDVFEKAGMALFPVDADNLLGAARQPLGRLARLADATLRDVDAARHAMEEARLAVGSTKALCDIIVGQALDGEIRYQFENWERDRLRVQGLPALTKARKALAGLHPFHFPTAFPEVFNRRRAGFDVILGNPPWDKQRVEEHEFWSRHFPGLRGLSAAERDARTAQLKRQRPDLIAKWNTEREESEAMRDAVRHIPGMATGHSDLFRAFLWRFTNLVNEGGGRVAVVLPGDAFKIKGGAPIREQIRSVFSESTTVPLTNRGHWVFDEVHPQKLIALFCATRAWSDGHRYDVGLECHSMADWHLRQDEALVRLSEDWMDRFSRSTIIPTLVRGRDVEILSRMMLSPRLGEHPDLLIRRVYADFETTRDKGLYHDNARAGDWPVYKGESFDIWAPDRGPAHYFKWAKSTIARDAHERRSRSKGGSPYSTCPESWRRDPKTHPALYPRVAFRDTTNRTNTRTLVAALIPPNVVTTQTAPWILFTDGQRHEHLEAQLIGVLSSLVCDWWIRRFAEGHVDEEAFYCLRVPRLAGATQAARQLSKLAGRLAAPDDRFADWAQAIGVKHGPLAADRKRDMIEELDAVVAHLYGLNEAQLRHIFETFHEGWDYEGRLERTLTHFAAWTARA